MESPRDAEEGSMIGRTHPGAGVRAPARARNWPAQSYGSKRLREGGNVTVARAAAQPQPVGSPIPPWACA